MDYRTSPPSTEPDETHPGLKPRRVERQTLTENPVAGLTSPHLYRIEVKVRDVSTCGFMAECVEPVQIGSLVSLDIPGIGAVDAQVRWQIGLRMGGMFLDPISLARCEWVATKAD